MMRRVLQVSTLSLYLFLFYCSPEIKTNPDQAVIDNLYKEEIIDAIELLTSQHEFLDTINELKEIKYEVLAIVLPEVIRWNAYQDLIEMTMDEAISDADLSIGIFQMKPSFVKELESYARSNRLSDGESSFCNINYESDHSKVKRLQQPYWQLRYAVLFWKVAENKFQNLDFNSIEERIHFYASAYNYGFLRPVEEIERWRTKKFFPYGKKYSGEQKAYGDFAVLFYKLLKSKQFKL